MNWKRCGILATALVAAAAGGQIGPINGIRPADLRVHAITNATVIPAPGERIESATIVIRDGVIEAVGADVAPPAEARVWDATGRTVYPGLIDPAVMIQPGRMPTGPGTHWNSRVHAQVSMADQPGPTSQQRKDLRALGFAAAAIYPSSGIMRGSGVVIALADDEDKSLAYSDRAAMAVGFDLDRGPRGSRFERGYPGSLMGAIALQRQTFADAQWRNQCNTVWRDHPQGNEPPIRADALDALTDAVRGEQMVLFDVEDELNALRAAAVAQEFELNAVLLGSGYEFRRIREVVATKLPIIVPLRFSDGPKIASLVDADRVSLRELSTWEQAPTNPRRLRDAGVEISLTTHRLKKAGDFPGALRSAIDHGLNEDAALAALTTAPAKLLGLDHLLGTIAPGKAANLVVVDGSLFAKKLKVMETWINGRRYEVTAEPKIVLKGGFELRIGEVAYETKIDTEKKSISITPPAPGGEGAKAMKAREVSVQQERVSWVMDGSLLQLEGAIRFTGVISEGKMTGFGTRPDGSRLEFVLVPKDGEKRGEPGAAEGAEDEEKKADEADAAFVMPPDELVYPLGEYGLAAPPQPQNVLVTNATLWTCGPQGVINNGWMIVRDGKIAQIGSGLFTLDALDVDLTIDAAGKHITPGLIDCHSHTGISGAVNEGGQVNTAEVRIGDVIDPDDIDWYRQLAGGLTACNQLHGSANPIGGQNSVVKLRWGGGPRDYPIENAMAGIKFALGENVVRSQSRYPNTRMGVETIIRDAFTAARDYQADWQRYEALSDDERARTMPPRRDLELDALVEILEGKRLVHCHSYRQDEILMLIRLADEFGFTIGTFQHVLEGYKVADAIAKHGAGGSSFSDWWSYKVEVMDAIPHNGAIMRDVGVLVSFNSDSNELARRMNTEAAKAMRYGGIEPHEALKFVTINAAKQLRIDDRVGSLEVGKDADFAIWSGDPLSTYTICEQTWIEGAKYFDLDADREMRAKAIAERERIVQKVLARKEKKRAGSAPGDSSPSKDDDKEDEPLTEIERWRAWMAEQIARGRDPEEMQPGDCGCGIAHSHHATEAQR